jgi:pimeloyl-ACP methyl ester carboxylesterase
MFERDDVKIHHEVTGDGFPILCIAPGGVRSSIDAWTRAPWNPLERLTGDYRLIAMDQRNAGESSGPITENMGWDQYTGDQLALLDHLGVERFAVIGMCIGGSYIAGLLRAAPERVAAAVMMQPIGLEDNRQAFFDMFDGWRKEIAAAHPEADDARWDTFRRNMFGGDFVFNASPEQMGKVETPLLVLLGDDLYHPQSTSRRVVELAKNATLVERWKEDPHLTEADSKIRAFLAEHAK